MIDFFFRHKAPAAPHPLRIHGIPEAPMTPQPDDAELAAQALLEHMSKRPAPGPSLLGRGMNAIKRKNKPAEEVTAPLHQQGGAGGGSAYYHALASRIRETQAVEARFAKRFVAYCEEQLAMPVIDAAEPMLLANLEQGLFERQHVVDREGGELKRRWQHCLADVTVRLMQATSHTEETTTDDTEKKDEHKLHE